MASTAYEIRKCDSCSLRYPLIAENNFGIRCPHCLDQTRVLARRALDDRELSHASRLGPNAPRVLLDNIRSAWNVGSILRTAEGLGFGHAYLCGITPGSDHAALHKTALGAEQQVRSSYHKDAVELARELAAHGHVLWGLELAPGAIDVASIGKIPPQLIWILGSERSGLDPGLLELCEAVYFIPMRGLKRSLNVAVAFGIAAERTAAAAHGSRS